MKVKLKCGATLRWDDKDQSIKLTILSPYGLIVDKLHENAPRRVAGRAVKKATLAITHEEDFHRIANFMNALHNRRVLK